MIKIRGSALLSALFIMTLVSIATTTMTVQLQHAIEQTRLVLSTDQDTLTAEVLRYWAMAALINPKTRDFGRDPTMLILTDEESPMPKIPGVKLSAQLFDLQAVFNLNNLDNRKLKTPGVHLFNEVLESASKNQAFQLINAISNWVSNDKKDSNYNKYNKYYAKQKPAYITAHQPMASLSELKLVQGVTPEIYQALFPYVTVLPPPTKININTAPEMLLTALSETDSQEELAKQVQALIDARGKKGIQSLNQVRSILKSLSIDMDDVTLESEYFLSIGQIKTASFERALYSVLHRSKAHDGTYSVQLVQETWNTN
ncbi:MAG: type II secretion system minor pseudopilin GspK [Legionella sp.]|jgi:general secretion pathway protein K|nr:type II secretion system minor pseudopilin GspK [Legionella sp.]